MIFTDLNAQGCESGKCFHGSESRPNLDKNLKFRNFLAFFWKEKFCRFPLSIKKRLKYSNPWTFRRNLAFSALNLLKFCSKMNNFWQIWLLDPDPDPLFFKRIRIRIREKITDSTDPGSGSETLLENESYFKTKIMIAFSGLYNHPYLTGKIVKNSILFRVLAANSTHFHHCNLPYLIGDE